MIPEIKVSDFDYELPDERIAKYPVEPRDASQLLVVSENGAISGKHFHQLAEELSGNVLMITNNTKVIPARLFGTVESESSARVEVFLLEPVRADWKQWQVMVGGRKKFKEEGSVLFASGDCLMRAKWVNREENIIELEVLEQDGKRRSVAEAIEILGNIPLPPYIDRDLEETDKERYQPVFAKHAGAVAAPTASLHFTDALLERLKDQGVKFAELTLHVGAGTFKPMTGETAAEHEMHSERFEIGIDTLKQICAHEGKIVAVGTTVMRVLESLYYIYRYKKPLSGSRDRYFVVETGMAYEADNGVGEKEMLGDKRWLEELIAWMEGENSEMLQGKTAIFIVPGFNFRVCDGIITNFHQPKSTLLMLVGAFLGGDWKKVYAFAMENGYRFLSYGDGSLLWKRGK